MLEFEKRERRSARIKGYICRIAGIAIIVLIIAAVILGYFFSFRSSDGEIRDGLGRILDEVPPSLSIILPQWAGHIWLIIDCIIIFGLIIFVDKLFVKSKIYFTGIKNVDF